MASGHLKKLSSCSYSSASTFTDNASEFSDNTSPSWLASVIEIGLPTYIDTMERTDQTEDVATVMTQILTRMGRVVEHLRDKGENEAANSIARDTISIIQVFNTTTAPWDMEKSTMRAGLPPTLPPADSSTRPEGGRRLTATSTTSTPAPAVTSWANVAAVAPAAGNKIVKFPPKDSASKKPETQPAATIEAERDVDKRVIWVRGWSASRSLSEITDRIGQGPIYSMAFSEKDSSVCIIFQYAGSAKALSLDDQEYTQKNGYSRFGRGCDVFEGMPFAENEDMRRMMVPLNERRRLTFARQQLFTHGMTEHRFTQDVHAIIGERNVELIWLFNSGNVPLARLVRTEFMNMAKIPSSPYHGVTISFSHDPCERPMSLITQMPAGRSLQKVGTYGRGITSPTETAPLGGPSSRRTTNSDTEGWQTISRKR